MDFENKTILITGASTGIGKGLSAALSKINCKLVLAARRVDLIQEIIDNLSPQSKAQFLAIKCDVSKKNEVADAYGKIVENFGHIDIAILNAGYAERMTAEKYDSKIAEVTFGVNIFGIVYWVEQLLPEFIKRKSGIIAGVSSLADNKGYSKSGFYSASKAAATIYLEGLSADLRKYNIKVITIKPGFVRTPMTDKNEFNMPLMMETEKASRIIINGIEKEKRLIQFPWQMVILSKVINLIPNKIFEILEAKNLKKYD